MTGASARSIRTDIESRIATGELQSGDRLPSVRGLADTLEISPATVSAAYRELRQRGMVVGRGRQGTLVAPTRRSQPTAAITPVVPAGLVDATNGSPDVSLLPPLGPALEFAATLPQASYGGALVEPMLEEAARQLFERDRIDASAMTVTSGAMDAVERVLAALDLRIGDRIGVEDPGHIPVHQLARSSGLELVPLPVDEFGVTPDGLTHACEQGLSAIVVTPRAHNPTGAAFTPRRAQTLSAVLADHPTVALVQDDHAGLISGVDYHSVEAPGPRWATMRSLGKSFGPDVRVALVAGDEQTIHRVSLALSNGPGWVSYVLQRLAAFLLTDAETMALLERGAISYQQRRDRLIDRLAAHGIVATGGSGLNVWIPTTQEQVAIDAARTAGFAIRGAASYRIASGPAVRVTISNIDNDHIDAIADALAVLTHSPTYAPTM